MGAPLIESNPVIAPVTILPSEVGAWLRSRTNRSSWADLVSAREPDLTANLEGMTDDAQSLEQWVATVLAALDLPADSPVDIAAILDLARVAAHGVTRPAAPLTTFIAGYAAGLAGGSPEAVARTIAAITAVTPEPRVG